MKSFSQMLKKIGSFFLKSAKERLVLKTRTVHERFVLKTKNERGGLKLRKMTDAARTSQIKKNLTGNMLWR